MTAIVERTKEELQRVDSVEGFVVFGSYARNEADEYSDLDMIVYLSNCAEEPADYESVKTTIHRVAGHADGGLLLDFGGYDKNVIYTKNSLLCLELRIRKLEEVAGDIVLVKESRMKVPETAIIFDRHGLVADRYRKLWDEVRTDDVGVKFSEYLAGFLYYYNGFRAQLARGDPYRAYVNYTIAFYKLASLCAILGGERTNLYQPWFLTTDVIKSKSDVKKFVDSSSSMNPSEMWRRKDIMMDLFEKVVDDASRRPDLGVDVSFTHEFIHRMDSKYPEFREVDDEM
ncbi:MAG: nucleotidyltransferase family protein [Thermoplasmata archaeon]